MLRFASTWVLTICLSASFICAEAEAAAPRKSQMPYAAEWKKIDALVEAQQLEAAAKSTEGLFKSAQDAGEETEWTRALVKLVQLRTGLHGYETAVRFLKEQPWPQGVLPRATLELFYAQSLMTYLQGYSWEIRQRERVESKGPIDLKSWTAEQIIGEAQGAYSEIWKLREALGAEPVSALSEYVEPNNYPSGVRSTLRDAVTYFWVRLLADTSHWRPEQSNDLFRLDLKALIKGDPKSSASIKLDDPAVHPLTKMSALLDDLESWHRRSGQLEGALEARLERSRQLFAHFSGADDRALIRQDLEAQLPAFSKLPWWSMGMGTLADLWMQQGDLVRAHQVATEGARAFRKSAGSQKCRGLVEQIEGPDFSLTSMTSDGPRRRSVRVTHKNLAAVTFRAYRIDFDARIAGWTDYNLLPQGAEVQKIIQGQSPAAEWTVQLPATPDFQEHATYVTPPLDRTGMYLIAASADPHFRWNHNRIQSAYLQISDLVMTVRDEQTGEYEVRVLRGDSGEGDSVAEVDLHQFNWNTKHKLVKTYKTDAHGYVRIGRGAKEDQGSYFLVARHGEQRAFSQQAINFYPRAKPELSTAALVYTDRSVYRPMQKVFWKVVAYQGRAEPARYQTLPNSPVTVTLFDANNQKVEEKKAQTNGFGSAAGEFTLPVGRLLGGWRIMSQPSGSATIRVEEYKRPTFEVAMKDPETALRLNKPATLVGDAHYYFGLPVTSGQVRWRVTRQPLYPYWWGWFGIPQVAAQVVGAGTATLNDDGKFHFTFTPEVDPHTADAREVSYSYSVSTDVTDEGGETRSASRSFRLGVVAVEATVGLKAGFVLENVASQVVITRTDLDGTPRAGKGSWRLLSLRQPARALLASEEARSGGPNPQASAAPSFQTEGDALRARWDVPSTPDALMHAWPSGEARAQGATTHDARGEATVAVPPLQAGAYRLEYETVDDFGAKYSTQKEFVVGATKANLAVPAGLFLEQTSVPVGGTARVFLASGLSQQPLVLDIFRGATGHERRFLTAGRDAAVIELPITEEDRGGFSISLTLLRDYQLITINQSIFVPWDNKELSLEFATFRDHVRPGTEETWRIKIKGPHGKVEKGAVELLAYMYDQALDVFATHAPPRVANLYPSRARYVWLRSTLGQEGGSWVLNQDFATVSGWSGLADDRLKFFESYGIGGMGSHGGAPGGGGFGGQPMRKMMPMSAVRSSGAPTPAPAAAPEQDAEQTRSRSVGDGRIAGLQRQGDATTPAAGAPAVQLRTDFSETAFWQPQLLTDGDGAAVIQFKVPDSVTSWDVWVHAMTRDLTGGSLAVHTKSVKDLMVRPYLPRFLREGDQAAIRVVVNNASDHELKGDLTFEIQDPETHASLADDFKLSPEARKPRAFTVAAGKSAHLEFPLTAPTRLGPVAFKVVARAGDFSDGELRPLPVLPSRMHLAQSRFVTLHNQDKRVMKFEDLARNDDPSRINEQLVVTVDAQLFYSVLQALPYLVNYPYECTEQTLNRFVSTGIVSTIYRQYPAVAKMAQTMSARQTPLETWDAADPNLKMTLEESPWLELAKGGKVPGQGVLNVLDPKIAVANRESSLAKLRKAQTSVGAFPWWPGGPPSPYMTLYIAHGLARAAEYHVDFPKDVTQRAWSYLSRHFRDEYIERMRAKKADWEFLTFLNFVASSYPDATYTGDALTLEERKEILDYSFAHWKQHSPYLKGFLALTLKRMGRPKDAELVFASVMDSAKTTQDQGTYWAPEDRSWLWYNDTIESHAFALRTLMELHPTDPRRDGLVQWLLINKKLSQWKSTRATAEVIYALVKYLESEGALGIREDATVTVGAKTVQFVFQPDEYTGKKNQVVIPGPQVNAQSANVTVEKTSKGFAFASATWQFSTEKLPTEDRGDFFSVSRRYFRRDKQGREVTLQPLTEGSQVKAGDEVEVQISLRAKHAAEYVHLRDPRAAGLEPEDAVSRYKWDLGIGRYEEVRDSGTNFFFESLPAGEYTFKYRLRANLAGVFRVGPATVQSLYAPEFNAYSTGTVLQVVGN